MSYLHDTDYQIKIKQGLDTNINATATKNAATTGEPHWTTNGKDLYVFDGTAMQYIGGAMLLASITSQIAMFKASIGISSSEAIYFGDKDSDGSWRIIRSGNNLQFERRESSAWVAKQVITP